MINSLATKRSTCRLCDSADLVMVLPMKPSPIADAFIPHDKQHLPQPSIPLDLYQCQTCGHSQNLDIVNPELLFRDYLFQTGSSAGLVVHFAKYAKEVTQRFNIKPGAFVVEIGSNDGTLLSYFKDAGLHVLGIDPARSIAQQATAAGISTLPEFFTSALANQIATEHGKAKLLVANNVYAHSDQLADITDAIASLLDEDGVFVFEVSYLLDIIDKFLFDTIYHEHLSYHSITALQRFFTSHGLHLFDVEKIASKGGSIRGFAQKIRGPHQEQPVIASMIAEEERRGLHEPAIFKQYEKAILLRKEAITAVVDDALRHHKRIVAYGASTTVITLMYHFELESKLAYLVDDNPKKQGLFSPGCHLEVKPGSVLYTDKPDIVIVLAWQYAEAIMQKHPSYVADGGVFIVPLPSLTVMSSAIQPEHQP